MNYEEFKARTTEKASYETFQKFEKMYMAGDLDKDVFCHLMKPLVVALTEAAPFRAAQYQAHADYHEAITNAHIAMEEGRIDDFIADLKNAELAGRSYVYNKTKADNLFNGLI